MANAWHRTGVWVIDTADPGVIDDRRLFVKAIRWVGATTSGHTAEVQDKTGARLWSGVAFDANNEEEVFREQWVDGLIVPTLQSGYLEIVTG